MTQSEMAALLGRPLTAIEFTNFDLYLEIATENLEQLTCITLSETSGNDTRLFDAREGYSTVFMDIFTEVDEVKIDDVVQDTSEYSLRQWDKRIGSWYNSLVFDNRFTTMDKVVEVTASWGFSVMPKDLQAVLAGLFDLISKKNKLNPNVASKQNRDYRISFNTDIDLDTAFNGKYAKTLSKYSLCDIPYVLNGEVCGIHITR